MSTFDRNAESNHGTNMFIKDEPHQVDLCYNGIPMKSDLESPRDLDCDEQFISQAEENTSSCLNLDIIKCENLVEKSSFSYYVDQDFKPNVFIDSFCLESHLDSETCVIEEFKHEDTHWDVKKGDKSIFQQYFPVSGCGSQDERMETHDSQENVETKFDKTDLSFDLKPDIDVIVKSEVDGNSYNNKENSHCRTVSDIKKLMCQCKEENNELKKENISSMIQCSHLVKDTDKENKSTKKDNFQSLQRDQNTGAAIDESSCDYHLLLIQENLSNILKKNENHSMDNNQGITLMSNRNIFDTKQDLLFESSSSVQRPHAPSHIVDSLKNRHSCVATFQCLECSECFNSKSSLRRHEITHKWQRLFKCSECSKCFTQKSSLRRHKITHKGLRPFKCSECSKCFTQKGNMLKHKKIHTRFKPFQCLECFKCFTNETILREHEITHRGLRPFKCPECLKCFTKKSSLTQHEKIHKGLKPFQCLECSKSFIYESKLRNHELTHKNLKPFKCSECFKGFTQKAAWIRHEGKHKVLKPFQCSECSKSFIYESKLRNHEMTHKNLKPFKCSECSKCYARIALLTQHENVHKGLKPFQCLECSKFFNGQPNLSQHEKAHKAMRPFKCSECCKCYKLKSLLTRHEKIVHDLNVDNSLNVSL